MTTSTVREILKSKPSSAVRTIETGETTYRAMELMTEHNIGSVLVLQNERVIGIVSERDCARKILLGERSSSEVVVDEVMTSPVLYVEPDETAEGCMALMTDRRVRHLPVLEHGSLVGLISIGDIVKTIVADREFLIEQLMHYITGSHPTNLSDTAANKPATAKLL